MDGLLWFLAQLAWLLALSAVLFFLLGWKIRGHVLKQVISDLEARVDEEDRGRRLALEERDAARKSGAAKDETRGAEVVAAKDWEEAQQQQRIFEREILRLNDELKAARALAITQASLTGEAGTAPSVATEPEEAVSQEQRSDDLTLIKGIGAVIARKLNEAGVWRFEQIAAWTDEEAAAFSERLSFKGRVTRDKWREQARAMSVS